MRIEQFPSVVRASTDNCLFFCATVIAVAIGPAVYFYKNVKPYFKYTFPSLPVDPLEKEIWKKVRERRQ